MRLTQALFATTGEWQENEINAIRKEMTITRFEKRIKKASERAAATTRPEV